MKKLIIAVIALTMILSFAACGGDDGAKETASSASDDERVSEFIEKVKEEAAGRIGEGTEIKDITLEDRMLYIAVDQGDVDEDLRKIFAEDEFSRITDGVLALEDYYDLWDKVRVGFLDIGNTITKTKDDIEETEYGNTFAYENGTDIGWD